MKLTELLKNKAECDNLLKGFENVKEFLDRKFNKNEQDIVNLNNTHRDIKRLSESKSIIDRHINYCYN